MISKRNLVKIEENLDITDILVDIKKRESIRADGTFYIYIKTKAFYVISNDNKFFIDEEPYIIVNNKKQPISFIC